MRSVASRPWSLISKASWPILALGALTGLVPVILSSHIWTVFAVVTLLVGAALLAHVSSVRGVLEVSFGLVLTWYFATESIIGSRYFHADPSIVHLIIRIQGIVPGVVFILMAAYIALSRRKKWYKGLLAYELWLVVFLVLDLCSVLVGLLRGNNLVYLVGDAFKYAFIPLAYFVSASALRTAKSRTWVFKTLVALGLAYSILSMLLQLYNFLVHSKVTLGRGMDALSWIYVLLVLAHWKAYHHRGTGRRWWFNSLAALVVVGALLSLERRDWLLVPVSILGVIWIARSRIYSVAATVAVLSALIALSAIVALGFGELAHMLQDVVERRIDFTFGAESGLDISSLTRIAEIRLATDHALDSGGIANLVLGMGSGAEFYAPEQYRGPETGSRVGFKHQIHNSYFSVLFRMGAMALIVLVLFLATLMLRTYRYLSRSRRGRMVEPWQMDRFVRIATLFLFLLLTILVEWNVAYGIGNIQVGIVLGLLGAELRDKELEGHENPHPQPVLRT